MRRILSVLCAIIASCAIVGAHAAVGMTHVTVTNNTPERLTVTSKLTTTDHDFKKGSDWDNVLDTLEPYQSKEVLWFSRNTHVKENQTYQYNLMAHLENHSADNFVFRADVKAHYLYGSEMTNEMQLPQGEMQRVLTNKGLEHHPAHFWDNDYVIHARRWKPTTGFFTNVHIVIEKSEQRPLVVQNSTTLNVLTYNTQLQPFYGQIVNDLNDPARREQDIVPAIKNYDVVIFQELFDRSIRNTLTQDMTANYPFHTRVVGDNSSKFWTGGVMIFSKWPIEKEDQIVYQATTGSDKYAAKGVAYAMINKNGMHYHVFGTHLEADNASDDVRVRRKQLAELGDFIDRMNIPASQPVLIGGDMNIDEFSLEASTLYSMLHIKELPHYGYVNSMDALINTMAATKDRARIDYVFYDTRHLVPKTAYNRVFILRALYDEVKWSKFDLSDHFPVEANFQF